MRIRYQRITGIVNRYGVIDVDGETKPTHVLSILGYGLNEKKQSVATSIDLEFPSDESINIMMAIADMINTDAQRKEESKHGNNMDLTGESK